MTKKPFTARFEKPEPIRYHNAYDGNESVQGTLEKMVRDTFPTFTINCSTPTGKALYKMTEAAEAYFNYLYLAESGKFPELKYDLENPSKSLARLKFITAIEKLAGPHVENKDALKDTRVALADQVSNYVEHVAKHNQAATMSVDNNPGWHTGYRK